MGGGGLVDFQTRARAGMTVRQHCTIIDRAKLWDQTSTTQAVLSQVAAIQTAIHFFILCVAWNKILWFFDKSCCRQNTEIVSNSTFEYNLLYNLSFKCSFFILTRWLCQAQALIISVLKFHYCSDVIKFKYDFE